MRELSAGKQRLIVLVALLAAVLAVSILPLSKSAGRAEAQISCDRASLETSWGTTVNPCLADTPTHLVIPGQFGGDGCKNLFGQDRWCYRWSAKSFQRASNPVDVKMADGTTKSLYRLKFNQMTINDHATLTTENGAGNVVMQPKDHAEFGDNSNAVNVWVEPTDTVAVNVSILVSVTKCDNPVEIQDSVLGATALAPLSPTEGCAIDLHIYYMASQNGNGNNTVSLPNTNVEVTQ